MKKPDKLTLLSYLSLFYELFLDSEPALAPSDEEVEPMLTEDPVLSSTPVTKGGHEVSEGASEDRGSQKKKRKRSLFRRSSKKKLLGASPSSVDRLEHNYHETSHFLFDLWSCTNNRRYLLPHMQVMEYQGCQKRHDRVSSN